MEKSKSVETSRKTYQAACDIYEENGKVVCKLEMPGVSKENLAIKIDGDRLMINGKKTMPSIKGEYKMREIADGDYQHIFSLDDTIDREKIDASIKNGIVKITLTIKESEKPRKIQIHAA